MARYIGRVGALALAMGIGAAVTGGAGLAHADDTTVGATAETAGGGVPAPSSPPSATATDGPTDTPAGGAGTTREPTSTGVPQMQGLSGGVPTSTGGVDRPTVGGDQDSPSGLIAGMPSQLATLVGAGGAPVDPPTDAKPAPQSRNRSNDSPGKGNEPSIAGVAEARVVSGAAADASTPLRRKDARSLGVVSSSTAQTTTASPVAAELQPVQAAPARVAAPPVNPIATVVSGILNALGLSPTAGAGYSPFAPIPLLLGVIHLIGREIERVFGYHPPSTASFTAAEAYANAHPATASGNPDPTDDVHTAYGDIGKWMLEPDQQISDYGGQPYHGRTLLESVNVIIVDPSSTDRAQSTQKLYAAMFWAGFPAQPIHTTGFQGRIDDVVYGQQPAGLLLGFSDSLFIFPNDHGRVFGPDPVQTSKGYVWSGAFSTEALTIYDFLPAHAYISSDMARTALALRLILSGQATFAGMVPLDNAYHTETTTTGDHDGYAVVLQLK